MVESLVFAADCGPPLPIKVEVAIACYGYLLELSIFGAAFWRATTKIGKSAFRSVLPGLMAVIGGEN